LLKRRCANGFDTSDGGLSGGRLNDAAASWLCPLLTEARAGDLYFCLEHRLVTIREQPIELTIKEFEIFSLLLWVISLLTGFASWNKI